MLCSHILFGVKLQLCAHPAATESRVRQYGMSHDGRARSICCIGLHYTMSGLYSVSCMRNTSPIRCPVAEMC
jgi:hypothetical protein